MRKTIETVMRWAVGISLAGIATLLLVAFGIDRLLGREVLLIAPHDEATVKVNRSLYLPGDPAAEIYGNPLSRPVRVVLTSERDLLRPTEAPDLRLLAVDSAKGQHPLQVQTVWFVTRYAAATLLGIALGGALMRFLWG